MTTPPHQPRSRARHGWAVALCLALTLGLGGCGGQPDPPSADGTTAPATTAPATSATTPQPPIPTAFPVPPGATESTASSTGQDSVRVQFEVTPSSAAELVGFFDEQLEAQGWTVSGRRQADGTTRYRIEGHGWTGAVTVFGDLDPVAFLVQLGTAPE